MKERLYSHSRNIKSLSASAKADKEDWREIIGIFLSLLVIAAFVIIAFNMAIPKSKSAAEMVTSKVCSACLRRAC